MVPVVQHWALHVPQESYIAEHCCTSMAISIPHGWVYVCCAVLRRVRSEQSLLCSTSLP